MLKLLLIFISFLEVERVSASSKEEVTKCLVEGVNFEPGIHKRPFANKCMYMYCMPDGVATVANCPQYVAPPKDCEHGEYLYPDGDYPKCCRKKIICEDDE